MRKKIAFLLSILLVCIGCAACAHTQDHATPAPSASGALPTPSAEPPAPTQSPDLVPDYTLSIACVADSYNPYLVNDSLVEQAASLLFCNFIEIAPDFTLSYQGAAQVICSGTTVTVSVRTDLTFADGTPITAQDALASFLTATQSTTYAARFANVLDATLNENKLVITLAQPDDLFPYLLDIPLLKESEVTLPAPCASGQYTYSADGTRFVLNPNKPFEKEGPEHIDLVFVSNYDALMSELVLGNVNYTTLGEDVSGMSTTISAAEHYYKTNNLLFVGANALADNPLCNTNSGRNLLSALLNRKDLTSASYSARAYSARGALNSFYPCALNTQVILPEADDSALAQTMEALGYHYNEEMRTYRDANERDATISILVNSSNTYKAQIATFLANTWRDSGIQATITEVSDFENFLLLLQSGKFELYIGEVKLYNNMELSSFFGGATSYGITPSAELLSAYAALRADSSTAAAFETAFAFEMPYIPLMWRNGIVATSRTLSGAQPSLTDPFYSFERLTTIS